MALPLLYSWPDNSGDAGVTELLHVDLLVPYELLTSANVKITVGTYVVGGSWYAVGDTIQVIVRSGGTNDTVDGSVVHTEDVEPGDLVAKYASIYEGPIRFQFTMANPGALTRLKIDPLGANSVANPGKVATCTIFSTVVLVEESA